mmetsp:Transcript_111785/g.348379  ORF Transcript_111785/g.348379 Transcript_111785/m.348379 type:complete len:198 (+) Transcript_111785:61-654(+)
MVVVRLEEKADEERLAAWLNAEDEEMQLAVDGGNFGRPLMPAGIRKWWDSKEAFFREQRGWETLSYRIFDVVSEGAGVCGHIEVAVIQGTDPEMNVATRHCGSGVPFGWLLYVYILPAFRGGGVGSEAVAEACRESFRLGALSSLLIVKETNVSAKRFYGRLGFVDTGRVMVREGCTFQLFECKAPGGQSEAPKAEG